MTDPKPKLAPDRHRRVRNWALFLALLGFVALVYAITIVKIRMGYGP